MPGPYELIVILLVVLLVFGAARLPEVGKYLGKGIREFKKATKGLIADEDEKKDDSGECKG
ncbi:MAG: twin-arginine translocase TatA/TatE family subunit [Candidatus Omnitrophica bacterium]|nr:twin-arginine translocase TatA/TatE family subunit [Candidatus Omnitrophota bacterium]